MQGVNKSRHSPKPRLLPGALLALLAGSLPAWGQGSTAMRAVPAETLARAAALATEAARALSPAGARVQAQPGVLDPRLSLAPCARIEPYLVAGQPSWGRTRVGLRCTEGSVRWNVFLPLTVQVWAPAVAVKAALPAGARLTQDQLSLVDTDWAAATQPPLSQLQALEGRSLGRPMQAGQALRAGDLQPRQWFASGDVVRIVAAGSGFSISAEGQALGAGYEGGSVRVRTEAGRVLTARPVGERRVEIDL